MLQTNVGAYFSPKEKFSHRRPRILFETYLLQQPQKVPFRYTDNVIGKPQIRSTRNETPVVYTFMYLY